ncbi:VCBS repeat-containing protein [Vibrio crassostreae]|nr:VCBS repeat-containing protein [Vibrio crassostreae]CAK3177957.1 VCBS repeat-containing protein [Vibrio crassostreae]
MANKKNVEANKKNTETKNKKSNELEQQKPTKKKKLRLHSHLKVNIPLFQSLMMILPSLAKHAAAETIDNSSGASDQVIANNVTEKDVTNDHTKADSSSVALQEAQTSDSDVNSILSASHAPNGSSSHLVPSHHLSTLSHPQVHYIPSVSMPTISSGSNGQPTHSNAPTMPALPVTFMPEVIKGTYGELHVDANGQYTFVLNPNSPQYILLSQHQPGTDHFALHLSNGSSIIVQIPVIGKQDTPSISGDLTGVVTEDHNIDSQGLLHANGKIDVIDPDQSESSVTPEVISGKYGSLTIDAYGHWQYQVDNSLSNVQALTAATSLHESFTIHTKDGTPQTIDMTIGGNDDNTVITGVDAGTVTEDLTTQVQGQLSVTDSDLGEDHFQASQVTSNFGTLSITKDGAWTYDLDNNNPVVQGLGQGSTATDIVTVHSADGTAHQVTVTINGTNDHAVITSSTANSPSSFFAIGRSNGSSQVTEDKDLTVSGQLNITDIDSKEAHFSNSDLKGTLGTLHLKDNGDWTYDLDNKNPQVQALGKGSATTDIITIHSADGTPHQITITVNGTNDKAVISGTSTGLVTEESQLQTSGTLAVTDVDTGEAHFSNTDIVGSFGTLHLTDTGSWTYDLDNSNPNVQALGKGATATDTITIHSADGTPHQVRITVNGTNDTATVSSATVAIDETDKAVTTSGTLTSTDVDNPDNAFTPDSIAGTNGDLTIDANGHWVFTASSSFNQLNVGDKVEETFTVTSVDGTPSTIKVTINGTNDTATVSSATVAIDETDKAVTTSGTLTSTDVDNPDNAFTPDSIIGSNGNLNIDADGNWTFTANSAFNQLNVGDKVEETFTVNSVDGTPSTIKVTINGTNDKATVSTATVAVDETDKAVVTSGTLTSTDVDNPNNAFTPDSIAGTNGDLTIDANGHWVFTANSAFNQLNVGDKVEETFTVSSIDGTPSTLKVTINGTNDAATVSTATVSVDETNSAVTTSGTLTSIDVDNPGNTFTPDSISGTNGDLTIDANGHWVFTANGAFNQLNVGDKVEETFTVSSIDGTTSTIKVMINGTNDAATVSTATVSMDETNSAITTSGTLTSTDMDNPDNTFTPDSIAGTNGDLTIDATGHWVFTANSAFNQLNVGDKVEETFTVSSVDGTPSTIKVVINGTNDAATVSSATVAIDETDKAVTTSGTLTSTDVDNPDNAFTPDSIAGTNGDLTIDANGHWVFTANSAFNQLNVGDKVEETFTVNSIDGTPSTIKVTINGTNDAATVSTATIAVDETDTAISTSGTLTSTDVDNPDNAFTPDSITGTNGDLTIDANGHWSFTANNAFNQLNVGDKVEETFTVSSIDGTPSTIKVTINGTNDSATVSSATVAIDETDKTVTTSGTLTSTDVDNPDNAFTPDSITGTNGDLTIDTNGHWVFTANSAFNQLNVGDKVEETFTVSSIDGTPSTIKVTINGTNDSATVSSATLAIDETDKAVTTSGTLTSTDVDNPDNAFTPDSITGTNGDLTIDANGHWVFTANSAFNQLNIGDKVEETFTVSSVDGTPSTIKVTINGTNDKATVSSATLAIDETDKAVTTSGTLTSTDVDNPDNAFTPDSISGTNGDLTIDANGHWTFTANSAFNQLNVGDKVEETFTVASIDGTPSTIKVTINGTNDQAVITGTNSGTVTEESQLHTSGKLTVTDADTGEAHFSNTDIVGTFGTLHLTDSGAWSYDLDNNSPQVQALGAGSTSTDSITVASADGTTHQVMITVNGTNDSAVIAGSDTALLSEDIGVNRLHQLRASGQLSISDADTGESDFDSHGRGATAIQGSYGKLNINGDGHWGYSADNNQSAIQALGKGETLTETLTVTSKDGTTHDIVITINGTNDAPVITPVATQTVREDGSKTITFHATDVDATDTLTPSVTATHGSATLNAQGEIVFTPDANYNGPAAVVLSVTDGHTTTSQTINVDVTPENDAPVINTIASISSTEDGTVVTGQITSTDIDTGDTASYSTTSTQGGFTLNSDGSYHLDPTDASFQHLKAGEIETLTIPVTVTDSAGATDTKELVITITGTNDIPTISGLDTGDVHEGHTYTAPDGHMTGGSVDDRSPDHMHGNIGKLSNDLIHTEGQLIVTDADNGEGHVSTGTYQGQFGHIIMLPNGEWNYYVSIGQNSTGRKIDHLGQGETLTDTVAIKSADGTRHDINITIHGDNDRPYCSSEVTLVNGEEDKAIILTSAQLLQYTVDVDANDANDAGKLSIDNLQATHGAITVNPDGTFTFTPEKDYNGAVHFDYDVKDVHGGSTHTGASISLAAVDDKAIITGLDTGDINESSRPDRSPDHAQPGIGEITNDLLYADGKLTIVDPDAGDNTFDSKGPGYSYHGQYGNLMLLTDGTWHYTVEIGQQASGVGRTIDKLGDGDSLTDNITVYSKDGTAHDIVITIHGDNDKPYCSSEVVLNSGHEDTAQVLTLSQLLQNSIDVDANDVGKLSIDNLHADHGAIAVNPDGTFTFTPEKDYSGDVHFTYDVKDAHGGATHTGASTTLAAVNDAPDVTALTDTVTEDTETHHQVNLLANATDKDGDPLSISQIQVNFDGQAGPLPVGVTMSADGHTLLIDSHSPIFQHLSAGQTSDITLKYMVNDNHGGQTPATATVTVVGSDDKAQLQSSSIDISEAQALHTYHDMSVIKGQVSLIDPDSNDNTQFVHSLHQGSQGYGQLSVWPDGHYTYNLDWARNHDADDKVAALKQGESLTDQYQIQTSDGQTKLISVTIHGEESGARIEVMMPKYLPASQDATEDHFVPASQTHLYAGGLLKVIDPDHGDAYLKPEIVTTAHHGEFTISADGGWKYLIDNNNDAVQHLGQGESFTDTHTVYSKDGSASQVLSVTIHGTNDAPIVSAEVKLAAGIEDTNIQLTTAELLSQSHDIDVNDMGQLSIDNLHADHGAIAVNADGSFTFTPDKNYSGDVHFTYDVKDAHGGVTTTGANINLKNVADTATFSGVDTGNITEDKNIGHSSAQKIAVSGSLTVIDPDAGQDHFQYSPFGERAIHDPFHGDLHITPQGNWGYSVKNSALQYLHEGDVEHVIYRVHSADGTSHDITITVTGTNDAPVLAAQTQSVIEDGSALQGQMQATDVDYNSRPILSFSIANPVDGLTFNTDGSYTFDPAHASYQHLGAGEEQTITIPVTVKDEVNATSTQNLTITVHGTNDAPVVSAATQLATGTEDTVITLTSAQLLTHASDVDHNDIGQLSVANLTADHGAIAVNSDGTFTFTPEKNYNGDVHFSYDVKDAHGGVTHTGASTTLSAIDDTAIISGLDTGDINESSRPDRSPDHAQPGMGEITNDILYADGKLSIQDGDVGENTFDSKGAGYNYHGQYGNLMLLTDGTWHYTVEIGQQASGVGTTIDKLGENQTLTDTITVFSKDGTAHDIVITIHGDNDRPYCASEVQLNSGKEDLAQTITATELLANTLDVDANDLGKLTIESLHADHGSISDNHDGTFTFTPEKDYNGDVHFNYDVKDAHGGITHTGASTTLAAVDDATQISGVNTGTATEDIAANWWTGIPGKLDSMDDWQMLSITDSDSHIDQVQVEFAGKQYTWHLGQDLDIMTPLGKFELHSITLGADAGKYAWLYVGDNNNAAVQGLKSGESLSESIKLIAPDGTTFPLSVNIQGTDDGVIIDSHGTLAHVIENSSVNHNISGQLMAHDADNHDSVSWGHTPQTGIAGQYGTFHVDSDGAWHFDIDSAKAAELGQGRVYYEHFTIEAISSDGSHASKSISIEIEGHNDNPQVTGSLTLAQGTEDSDYIITPAELLQNATNVDINDRGWLRVSNLNVDHGKITVAADGSFVFHPDKDYNGSVQFSYDVIDRHGGSTAANANLALQAINDAPIVSADVALANGVEDSKIQLTSSMLLANATDVDINDLGKLSVDNLHADHGSITSNSDGSFTFTPEKNYNGAVHFSYDIKDAHGGVTHTGASTTLSAVNDAGVITGDKSGTVSEDNHVQGDAQHTIYTVGVLDVTDPDAGENHFHENHNVHALHDPFGGSFTIGKAGDWSYSVPNANVQHLAKDQVETVQYEVLTQGGDKQIVTVSIHGSNDAPTLSVTQTTPTTGTLLETDVDVKDTHSFSVVNSSGQFGDLSVDPSSGAYVYTPNSSISGMSYNSATRTYHGTEVFEVKVADNHGGESSRFITFDTNGHVTAIAGQQPSITTNVPKNPVVTSVQPSLPTGSNTPPINAVTVDLAASSDSGNSDTDNLTNNNTPTITGHTDIPYSQVTIYDGSTAIGHATSDATGHYSAQLSSLSDGAHHLSAKALDPSSTVPVVSPLLDINVDTDTVAPSADLQATSDSGSSSSDHLTNVHTPVITGSAEVGCLVQISDEQGVMVASGKADGNGQYHLATNSLAEGAHALTVTATDEAGNQQSTTLPIEVDYTAPTIAKVNLRTETTHQPTFSGTVSPDTEKVDIIIKHGSTIIETLHATLDGKGGYTVDATNLPDRAYTAYIQATDQAGNTTASGYHGTYDNFSVDTQALAPSISFESAGADNIYNTAEVASGAAGTITTTIHLPNDIAIDDVLTINGQPHTITNAELIARSVSVEIAPGASITASLTDSNGNTSPLASATAPIADTAVATLGVSLTHDTGALSDHISSDGSLTITGQEPGAIVEYSIDSGAHWTQSFTPIAGQNNVTIRQTDSAGNVSPSTTLDFTLDNTVAAPTVSLQNDTGRNLVNTPDFLTKDSQLSIQTEAGAKIEYSNDDGKTWSTVFNPVEGINNLQVRQTDIAGNQSAATHFSFTLDTTPGTVTVNPISQDNALNAAENNQPLVITGTTSNIAPGDNVYVVVGNNHFYDAIVKADGSWSLTLSANIHQSNLASDKDYSIQVGAVDAAGNSTPRISTHLLIDTQNPLPHIAVDSVTQDNVLNALESGQNIPITGTVTGDYHAGDTVSLKINGANIPSLTGTVDATGHFSIPVAGNVLERANIHTSYASGQAAPIHSIEATIQTTDAVGNIGTATSGTQVFTVDTQIAVAIQTDAITADNVINAQESQSSIDITGTVSGDFNTGDVVTLNVNGIKHTGAVDSHGHYSIAVPGSELIADADQKIEASIAVTDSAGNSAHATTDVVYQVDTQVSLPTITFESAGADNLYSKAEIARGDANTITATITPPGDAKIGEHLVVNGQDHVLDAHSLQNGLQIEVAPGSHVQVTMTDEHGNTAGSQGFAASAIPDPIIVKAPPGSHQVSGSLGTPPLLPSLTPVPTAQHGWRIHLPDGSYVTSHHGQYGTLTIDPQTGDLHYQEQANVHTGPHGSASGIGQHEDKFEVALQGTNQDEVVAHVNVQILSHGPGNSGKLNIGTEVVDMTITPITHTSHPAPPPPPQVLHDEPDMSSQADFTVTQSDDSYLDLTQHAHQAPDQKTSHHGAAAYLDALGIKPDTTSTVDHDQPADMDIVLAQVDQQDAATHDQAHLDMSDALEHHDANVNHNQDDEHHHHNDVDGLPDIDPNP